MEKTTKHGHTSQTETNNKTPKLSGNNPLLNDVITSNNILDDNYFNGNIFNESIISFPEISLFDTDQEVEETVSDGGDPDYLSYKIEITQAANVQSVAIAKHNNTVRASFKTLIQKRNEFQKILPGALDKIGANETEKGAIQKINKRWVGIMDITVEDGKYTFGVNTVDPLNESTFPIKRDYCEKAIEHDLIDFKLLTGKKFENFKNVVLSLHKALNDYLNKVKQLNEEKEEKKRFDKYYKTTNAKKLLAAITQVKFTEADIKAMQMQETGDFTNINVAGIEGKTKGLVVDGTINTTFKGIGQIGASAKKSGIDWALKKGVVIGETINIPDPTDKTGKRTVDVDSRLLPEYAILLTISYMGAVCDSVYPALPTPLPAQDELKKIMWASYNMGPTAMKIALAKLKKNKKANDPYTFADLAKLDELINVKGQPIEYVIGIIKRLSWKGLQ